jgi:hypothetical protein
MPGVYRGDCEFADPIQEREMIWGLSCVANDRDPCGPPVTRLGRTRKKLEALRGCQYLVIRAPSHTRTFPCFRMSSATPRSRK